MYAPYHPRKHNKNIPHRIRVQGQKLCVCDLVLFQSEVQVRHEMFKGFVQGTVSGNPKVSDNPGLLCDPASIRQIKGLLLNTQVSVVIWYC